jgi:hypothetical protein
MHAQETAINIGFACSLLRTDMAQYIVNGATKEVQRIVLTPNTCKASLLDDSLKSACRILDCRVVE